MLDIDIHFETKQRCENSVCGEEVYQAVKTGVFSAVLYGREMDAAVGLWFTIFWETLIHLASCLDRSLC